MSMNDSTPRPECTCTLAGDPTARDPPSLHQEHCAIARWWWDQAIRITCARPGCKRVESVDLYHPQYAEIQRLPEPRKLVCSACAIKAFTF